MIVSHHIGRFHPTSRWCTKQKISHKLLPLAFVPSTSVVAALLSFKSSANALQTTYWFSHNSANYANSPYASARYTYKQNR